jgi:hypothetical protein
LVLLVAAPTVTIRQVEEEIRGSKGYIPDIPPAGRVIESRRIAGVQLEIVQEEPTHLASVRLATGPPALNTLAYLSRSQAHCRASAKADVPFGQVDYTISATGARTGYSRDARTTP